MSSKGRHDFIRKIMVSDAGLWMTADRRLTPEAFNAKAAETGGFHDSDIRPPAP